MSKLTGKAKANARSKERKNRERQHQRYIRELADRVRTYDDPVLMQKCEPVIKGEDNSFVLDYDVKNQRGEVVRKAGLLKKVLVATENGVGLAAPQIGFAKRAFVMRVERTLKDTSKIDVFINPEYVEKSEVKVIGPEGCLSYPEVYVNVERHAKVKIKYFDEHFQPHEREFEDFASRVVQHEMDHLGPNVGDEPICRVKEEWMRRQIKG